MTHEQELQRLARWEKESAALEERKVREKELWSQRTAFLEQRDAARGEVAEILTSGSYRLGHALTAPFRTIRKIAKSSIAKSSKEKNG